MRASSTLGLCAAVIAISPAWAQQGRWSPGAAMLAPRASACAAPLADGRLLVAGGMGPQGALDSVELYAADGRFHLAPRLLEARADAACVTLPDGRVLVAGGTNRGRALASSEIFDPASGAWSAAGSMRTARAGHRMAVTAWGSVVVAGGDTSAVEIFTPGGGFRPAGRLSSTAGSLALALLCGHRLAFLGDSIDLYDSDANTVRPAGLMLQARRDFAAAALLDGRIFISGGVDRAGNLLSTTEIFDPSTSASTPGPDLPEPRAGHSDILLPHNGGILIVGGRGVSGALTSAVLFQSWNGSLSPLPPLATARQDAVAIPAAGNLLVAGGRNETGFLGGSEILRYPAIQPDRASQHPGDTIGFLGTGWTPGERIAIQVMALPADARGVLFHASGVADAAGRLQVGGFTIGHASGCLQVLATGTVSQALDLLAPSDATTTAIVATSPLGPPAPEYGNPVSFSGTVTDSTNPSVPVNSGTITVALNGLPAANGTVAVDANGNFSFSFDITTQYLPRGANAIAFQYSGSAPFDASSAAASYTVAPRLIEFNVSIGQPGKPNLSPMPGAPAAITVSTPPVNGAYPCGAVQLCISNICGGPLYPLVNGAYTFSLANGLYSGAAVAAAYTDTCDANFVSSPNPTSYNVTYGAAATVGFLSGSTPVMSVSAGQPITYLATIVTRDICTGTVQFYLDNAPAGAPVTVVPGNASGCSATLSAGVLPAGLYSVTAAYSGDGANSPSSGSNAFNVTPQNLPPLGGNNRVEIFNTATNYAGMFGTLGSGVGQMRTPCGLAVNPANNNIFVADSGNSRIEIWTSTGQALGSFGTAGTGSGHVINPCGLAFGPNGSLYVADTGNSRVDIFVPANSAQTAWNFSGMFGGAGITPGKLMRPLGVAILPGTSPSDFTIFVADTGNNRIQSFTPYGGYLGSFGETGSGNGQFAAPTSLAMSGGNLAVVDSGNNRIEVVTTGGHYVGQFGDNGTSAAHVNQPFAIAVCPPAAASCAGNLMVTDTGGARVVVFDASGAYLKQFGVFGSGSGQFKAPLGIAFFPNGGQVVSDSGPLPAAN